nr:multiple antibiotic resistance operon transcription repressor MarR [Streptococcus thermophilus]
MGNTDANLNTRLSAHEAETWTRVWACHMKLPSTLDAQLKRDAGVTYFEFQALLNVAKAPKKSLRMTELADATMMSLSHLSRVVTRLEKKGLVSRTPDPNDGRSTFATLTAAGAKTVDAGLPGHVGEMRRIMFDNLTDYEMEAVSSALAKMAAALAEPARAVVADSRLVGESSGLDAA